MFLSIDDTDSRNGMCTTYLVPLLLERLDLDLIGLPRLVRLNPTVPWKTRGNGAICLELGKGRGKKIPAAHFKGKEYFAYTDGDDDTGSDLMDSVKELVMQHAMLKDDDTNPGIIVHSGPREDEWYQRTVKGMVDLGDVKMHLDSVGAEYEGFKNGRGIIGANGAMNWSPGDYTYELLVYRTPGKIGTERKINTSSVEKMEGRYPSTFNNIDLKNKHLAIEPGSPCPILMGIRGDDQKDLLEAVNIVETGEPIDGWVLFLTNQATDDHVVPMAIPELKPYTSVLTNGRVVKGPEDIKGGHVVFSITESGSSTDCMAYEPTKEFRIVVRQLVPGDEVEVQGSVKEMNEGMSINLEKLHVVKLQELVDEMNPKCPGCGKSMESAGKDQGYRCRRCSTTAPSKVQRNESRDLNIGWYEVPVCARRHLHRPLNRAKKRWQKG